MIVFLADMVEMLRRTAQKDTVDFMTAIGMVALRLPQIMEQVVIFVLFFSVLAFFLALSRSNALTIIQASGVSLWRCIAPILLTSFIIGMAFSMLVNPVGAKMSSEYRALESKLIHGKTPEAILLSQGLWLHQKNKQGVSSILHAKSGGKEGRELHDVTIFIMNPKGAIQERIDATKALLHEGYWLLLDTWSNSFTTSPRYQKEMKLETRLQLDHIQRNVYQAENISFWGLPYFISSMEQAGFSTRKYQVHWYHLMALPVFLCGCTIVAALFGIYPLPRSRYFIHTVVLASMVIFGLYFLMMFFLTLGNNGVVAPFFAIAIPLFIVMSIGLGGLVKNRWP